MRTRLALTAIGAAVLAFAGGTVVTTAIAAPASATLLPKTIALPDGYLADRDDMTPPAAEEPGDGG